MKPVKNEKNCS